jgi:hypothetical protein
MWQEHPWARLRSLQSEVGQCFFSIQMICWGMTQQPSCGVPVVIEDTINCFSSYTFSVVAAVMIESSWCFWNVTNSGHRFFCRMFPNLLAQIIMYLCATTLGSWWSQWGVIRASHCHSSWRGWLSGTLWAILTRLWLHSFLFCFSGLPRTHTILFGHNFFFLASCLLSVFFNHTDMSH